MPWFTVEAADPYGGGVMQLRHLVLAFMGRKWREVVMVLLSPFLLFIPNLKPILRDGAAHSVLFPTSINILS